MDVFDAPYDSHLACSLFRAYKDTYRNGASSEEKNLIIQELMFQLAPLVTIVTTYEINPTIGDVNIDVLRLEALEYVFETLVLKYVPDHVATNHKTFTGYFWTMVKWGLLAAYRRNCTSQVFDFTLPATPPPSGRVTNHDDSEIRVYLNQFYDLVLATAINDIRFRGKERDACIFIGKCLLGMLKFSPTSARLRYKLSQARTEFLCQYMEHLLRYTMEEVKEIDDAEV